MTVGFSVSVGFIRLRYFIDVCFIRLRDFGDSRFCLVTRSQLRSVFNVNRFCYVMRYQWRSVLFGYEISMTVGF